MQMVWTRLLEMLSLLIKVLGWDQSGFKWSTSSSSFPRCKILGQLLYLSMSCVHLVKWEYNSFYFMGLLCELHDVMYFQGLVQSLVHREPSILFSYNYKCRRCCWWWWWWWLCSPSSYLILYKTLIQIHYMDCSIQSPPYNIVQTSHWLMFSWTCLASISCLWGIFVLCSTIAYGYSLFHHNLKSKAKFSFVLYHFLQSNHKYKAISCSRNLV